MICQKCGIKTATIHYTNIINGNKTELHLCEGCAKESEGSMPIGINDLMSGFLGIKTQNDKKILRCDFCGSTQNDISKRGKAGCEHCYEVFKEYLTPIIRKVHGTDTHVGKRPDNREENTVVRETGHNAEENKKSSGHEDISELENKMKQAVLEENYEEAAKIRDELKTIKEKGEPDNEHVE